MKEKSQTLIEGHLLDLLKQDLFQVSLESHHLIANLIGDTMNLVLIEDYIKMQKEEENLDIIGGLIYTQKIRIPVIIYIY